ncbi:MAG: nuclear transport factor 2 family protein [Hyphomicrobiaceae bacterium]
MSCNTMTADLGDIEAVVKLYLDGLYEGDAAKIGQAFHGVSHLYSVAGDGSVDDLPRAQWLEKVAARPSPKSQGHARSDRIVAIDQSGPGTAFVKVECAVPPRYFTDYLLLLKTGGGWKITAKSFHTDERG